jgi:hypothetical protein
VGGGRAKKGDPAQQAADAEAEAKRFEAIKQAAENKMRAAEASAGRARDKRSERKRAAAFGQDGSRQLTCLVVGGWSADPLTQAEAVAEAQAAAEEAAAARQIQALAAAEATRRGKPAPPRTLAVKPAASTERRAAGAGRARGEAWLLDGRHWVALPRLPAPRHCCTGALCGDLTYVVGGCEGPSEPLSSVFAFSHKDGAWRVAPGMRSRRGGCAAASVDKKGLRLVVCGGFGTSSTASGGGKTGTSSGILSTCEVLDVSKGTWTVLDEPMACGVSFAAFGVVGGKLIVAGGNAGFTKKGISAVTQAFDPATGAWERLADMPSPRAQAGSAVIKGKLYVIGGLNEHYQARASVFVYDVGNDSWVDWDAMPKYTKPAADVKRGETAKSRRKRDDALALTPEGRAVAEKRKEGDQRLKEAKKAGKKGDTAGAAALAAEARRLHQEANGDLRKADAEDAAAAQRAEAIAAEEKAARVAAKDRKAAAVARGDELPSDDDEDDEEDDDDAFSDDELEVLQKAVVPRAERLGPDGEMVTGARRAGDAACTDGSGRGLVLAGESPPLAYSLRPGWQELPSLPDRTQPAVAQVALFSDD